MKQTIVAHPGAKKPRILTDSEGRLHVYISQPAHEGKANQALIEALANHYKVSKNRIHLVAGTQAKVKVVEIIGK